MKLRKQIKNSAVAVLMLAVVLVSSVSVSFASVDKDVFNSWFSSGSYNYSGDLSGNMSGKRVEWKLEGADPIYLTEYKSVVDQVDTYDFYSKSDFTCNYKIYEGDKYLYGYSCDVRANTCKMFGRVYTYSPNRDFIASGMHRTVVDLDSYEEWRDSGAVEYCKNENIQVHLESTVVNGGLSEVGESSEWISLAGENLPGSHDNPIPDENIGTLVLKKSKCYWVKDGSMDFSQRVQWANKTDTDFSLTNNKYAITRIEVKIGNRVTYFGDVEHHGTGKKVDNFGKVYPFKYVIATDNPHDFSFKDMLSASKTDLSKYNAAMLEHEYDLYFRVVCGTAYGTSAEWHCGNWTRYRVTDDPKQDGKNESDNGHFNDNGEWEKDKDTDVDSGGIGNVDDKDDLEDDFNHFKDSENWKDWLNKEGLDLDSAKTFIDQVADVPKMIADLFSFFPDWVKYSFALGFGLIPVIIVIKFLRG